MNILEAKEYIKDTVTIYLKKDEFGDYKIPTVRQRPVFLIGAPGIGKSAIMEQIASELDIALVSYSMTHHTRQSALGLPFIKEKTYEGMKVDVSEYTMSEIISSIYETMEESGIKEGILFLDEINCVSETLYPSMLNFLQFKTFGRHRIPDGWVIVTAGNPPEYNKSVREFDVVTLDRLKVMNVEADYSAWRKYALDKGIHQAILGFLDNNSDSFYKIETTADGRSYVTARGWEDLSEVLYSYEESQLKINNQLIGQYLRCDSIIREFSIYYDLYNKYKDTYNVETIFRGTSSMCGEEASDEIIKNMQQIAGAATKDERLALTGMLCSEIIKDIKDMMDETDMLKNLLPALKKAKASEDIFVDITRLAGERRLAITKLENAGTLSPKKKQELKKTVAFLEAMVSQKNVDDLYNGRVRKLKSSVETVKLYFSNMFEFVKNAFGEDSNEMLVLVSELTVNDSSARFLAQYGSSDYDEYSKNLKVKERKEKLREEILELM